MTDELKNDDRWTLDQLDYVQELMEKAEVAIEKSKESSNVELKMNDLVVPLRVDDKPLFYIAMRLLPNIVNYLVNILPQMFYPYIVAYLQELSVRDDEKPITINDLFEIINEIDKKY